MALPPKTRRKAAEPVATSAAPELPAKPAKKTVRKASAPEPVAVSKPRSKKPAAAPAVSKPAVTEVAEVAEVAPEAKPASRKRAAAASKSESAAEPKSVVAPVKKVAASKKPAAAKTATSKRTSAKPVETALTTLDEGRGGSPSKVKPATKALKSKPAAAPAAKPEDKAQGRTSSKVSVKTAAKPAAKPEPKPATKPAAKRAKQPRPAPAVIEPEERFIWTADPDETLFGVFGLQDRQTQEQLQVHLRGAAPGDYHCSCASFARSDEARCVHSDFLFESLKQGGEPIQAMLQQGPQTPYSEVWLAYGAQRRLRWRAGLSASSELVAASQALLDEHRSTSAESSQVLHQLLKLAAQAGHELRIDAQVWEQLAWSSDAQQRVQRLESVFAEGPEGAVLAGLLNQPLPAYQWEAALFAVCAGRALLADDLGLSQRAPALAAWRLWQQCFGLGEGVLIAPAERHALWQESAQRLLGAWPEGLTLRTPDALDAAPAGDLLIVDALDQFALPLPPLPQTPYVLLLSDRELLGEPTLEAWIDRLDSARRGPMAHLKGLGDKPSKRQQREALQSVMLSRRRRDLESVLPSTLETQVWLDASCKLDPGALEQARTLLQRWQRLSYLSHGDQLRLMQALQQLKQARLAESVCAAMAQAVVELLPRIVPAAASRVLVAAQDDASLLPLAEQLHALGLSVHTVLCRQDRTERDAALAAWRGEQGQVLLATDSACTGLDLGMNEVALIHADLPWNPAQRAMRVQRVAGVRQGLPVWQLLLASSLDAGLLKAQTGQAELPAASLDGAPGAQPFVEAAALGQFMNALQAVLGALEPNA